ncbi:hypothetical protein TCAL_00339 [Tigriopus californicus]|uniref:Fibronectin type-III domain-containing protein n=1 Tax=Tigriopus californicus TaxID=6832 RepID=A0A553NC28_TIGCA|nr:uncharacterized protein LOC131888598 [Tigriopus californicus]XP_059093482.1 uncharacterized protein LOC131888598 [Tigriopus californicus]TRY62965.1 hypothetical protein TCAL_00339 [Tigriopus californicus]|eukprot:TCALIF_00339-PA protein Name:"Protein of unknown function" AED:0.00 eAED:0.00 QI:580/1/1/1/1/1/2/429/547
MNYKHESLIVGTLVLLQFYPVISLVTKDCRNSVQTILDMNNPEYLIIPNNEDLNTFTNTNIQVRVSWNHIHQLLDPSCVNKYFVEFSPSAIGTTRYKRESVSQTVEMSPPLSNDQTNFTKNLTDNCQVYSVKLAVLLTEGGVPMISSRSREFWPAAHRGWVELYSKSVVVKWPPNCNSVTQDWYIRACTDRSSDGKEQCQSVAVRGEIEVRLFDLSPCSVFQIDLVSSEASDGVVLWSFYDVKTLPEPILHIVPGHDRLSLNIRQLGCQKAALVKHWRITHCDQAVSSSQKRSKLLTRQSVQDTPNAEVWDLENGSGAEKSIVEVEDEDEDGEFSDESEDEQASTELYVYDTNIVPNSQRCTNSIHELNFQEPNELIVMSNLQRCTEYLIDVTPINDEGATIQPGERYATTRWTLCDGQDLNHPDIWIEPDGNLPQNRTLSLSNKGIGGDAGGTSSTTTTTTNSNNTGDGNGRLEEEQRQRRQGRMRTIYIWVSVGSAFGVLLLMGLAIWVTKKRRWQWYADGKQATKANLGSSKKCENDMLLANNN